MRTFLSVGQALNEVLSGVTAHEPEWMNTDSWLDPTGMMHLLGRRLSRDVVAPGDLPGFASSAMDGYAVRHEDLTADGGRLRVVSHAAAGHAEGGSPDGPSAAPSSGGLRSGEAVRIMTGAPIPAGATAVVPVEWTRPENSAHDEQAGQQAISSTAWTRADGGTVVVDRGIEAGKHVRPAAEDVRAGETVLRAGREVTPPVVGVLAGLGLKRFALQYQPRVAILSTGDEIVDPAVTPSFGQVVNTNGPGLAAQVFEAGGLPLGSDQVDGGSGGDRRAWVHVPDDLEALTRTVARAVRQADVVILSGGVSVGAHDHVQEALRRVGVELAFWKVRQRPGKPLLYGRIGTGADSTPDATSPSGTCHVFGLPGNPVSAAMCFEMYVRPLLQALAGSRPPDWSNPETLPTARLEESISKPEGLHWFVRGVAQAGTDGWHVRTTGAQGSNLYGSVLHANCVVHLPEDAVNPAVGSRVSIQWLPWANAPGSGAALRDATS